jgi:UDP-N-acetylmuramoyl-tripeptide--D-alanyl-D-alanine ligase
MRIPLQDAARAAGASASAFGDTLVTGWSVDTRTIAPGDLFFALRGPNHDAHDYADEAFRKGAAAAVVERDVEGAGPLIRVPDTLEALQQIASWARQRWGGEVIGITGSAGKTTTKDAIAAMLAVRFQVGKTTGNFNNHVGVPLSLLRVPDEARLGVIEMGMNHAGEIRDLARIARPRVGVVTNVGTAHIENFESIDGVAAAKRELVEALPPDGIAVLNADDSRVLRFRDAHPGRTVTFGFSERADVRAEDVHETATGARFRALGIQFESALPGRHGVMNLLAGIAVAGLYGIRPEELVETVRAFEPGQMRGRRFTHNGILIFDDCYNANPDAVRAMLDVLRDSPAERRIAVLGEMLELGRWAEALHRDVGLYAAKAGVHVLVGIRGVARQLVDAAIDGGLTKDAAFFFEQPEEAGTLLRCLARPGDAVLFKGSRGTHVEKALEKFLE